MADHNEQISTFQLIWRIEHFRFNALEANKCLMSPMFKPYGFKGTSWILEFYPRGRTDSGGYSSCMLCRADTNVEEIIITFKIDLLDESQQIVTSNTRIKKKFSGYQYDGFTQYCSYNLTSSLNVITICCSMYLLNAVMKLSSLCKARSVILFNRYFFSWSLKMSNVCSWSDSRIFPCSSLLSLEVTVTAPNDIVEISIKRVKNKKEDSHYIECILYLLPTTGGEEKAIKCGHFFCSDMKFDNWKFPSFITMHELISQKNKYIGNGNFYLKFEFCISNNNKREDIYFEEFFP